MSASTIYDIRLRYLMEDRAKAGVADLDKKMKGAAASSNALGSSLGRIGGLVAGYFGFQAAKSSLVDFNSNLEQSRITMAGLFEMNLGGTFGDNMKVADDLVGRLQQRMKSAVGTTQDAVTMASMLAQPFSKAGASVKEMEDMTVGAVVGAKSMGIAAEVAARDVDQALRGQFHSVDQFTGKLLGAMGYVGEEGRKKFNQMAAGKRFDELSKALNSPAIKDMAAAQASSFAGVSSTLQDNIEMFLGKVGTPVFKEITRELQRWNEWIEKNGETLEKWGRIASDAMVSGFNALRTAVEFIIEHKEVLLAIASAFAAVKVGGMLQGAAGSIAGMATKLGPGGLAIGAVGAAAGLTAAAVGAERAQNADFENKARLTNDALTAGARYSDAEKKARIYKELVAQPGNKDLEPEAIAANREFAEAARLFLIASQAMGATNSQDFRDKLAANYAGAQQLDEKVFGRLVNSDRQQADLDFQKTTLIAAKMATIFDKDGDGLKTNKKTGKGNTDVKVTINRIEVKSDDPDRFAFQFTDSLKSITRNPRALAAKMGG